jgi:acetyl-CoA acetyltransferase
MSKSGPLRTEWVGHSLTFVALCRRSGRACAFHPLGMTGLTLMERSVLRLVQSAEPRRWPALHLETHSIRPAQALACVLVSY